MKPKYIDVEWLMEKIREREYPLDNDPLTTFYGLSTLGIFRILEEAPTIDPESLRARGKWLTEYEPNGRPYQLHCSVCDSDFSQMGITHASNYCPNCGAKMEVSEDE